MSKLEQIITELQQVLAEQRGAMKAVNDLSAAYIRLRDRIPGAFDTPHAPTPEQVWSTTEAALDRMAARLVSLERQNSDLLEANIRFEDRARRAEAQIK
jgi:uncharacterized coiled-coil protein SlyX